MTEQSDTKKRKGLGGFLHHQNEAVKETGKAFASLLPTRFRDHAGNALRETKASWEALFDGMIDVAETGLDKLRGESSTRGEPGKEKVEVEVE